MQLPRRMSTCRINSVCRAGGSSFQIDHHNCRAALYCHDKYACPTLHTAAERWMERFAKDQMEDGVSKPGELLDVLEMASEYRADAARHSCIDAASCNMYSINGCVCPCGASTSLPGPRHVHQLAGVSI